MRGAVWAVGVAVVLVAAVAVQAHHPDPGNGKGKGGSSAVKNPKNEGEGKHGPGWNVCHATGDASRPYVFKSFPHQKAGRGHRHHENDIVGVGGPEDCSPPSGLDPGGQQPDQADLALTMVAARDGATVHFALEVRNVGSAPAARPTLIDMLPDVGAGWTVVGAQAGACMELGGELTCRFATLQPGSATSIAASIVTCQPLTNTARAWAVNEADVANNAASATVGPC